MSHFPAISSILSPSGLVDRLRPLYGLGTGAECRILKTGINDTYAVEDGDTKYVFRVYHIGWRTRAEIGEEIRLLNLLYENDIPVSRPVADLHGNDIQDFDAAEGARMGVMFSFAGGEKC